MSNVSTPAVRLQLLYEISKLLTRFAGVDETLPPVAAVLADNLQLGSVVAIFEGRSGTRRTVVWPAAAHATDAARAAIARAEVSRAYLSDAAASRTGGSETVLPGGDRFLTLPLVLEHAPIFGVLQLETMRPCDEDDLLFASAVVNQLSVALDRHLSIEAKQAAAESNKQRAETRRAEAEVMRRRFEALVDHLDHAFVWEADAETRQVFYVSARAELVLGFSRERWLAEADFWMTCVHPEDRRTLLEALEMALFLEKDQRCDHRCVTADGRVVWLHTGVHFAREDSGTPTLQGVSIDVTAGKRAEAAIQEQLEFSRAVTRSLGEGVIAIDLEARITFVNAAAESLLDVRQEEILNSDIEAVLPIRRSADLPLPAEQNPALMALRTGTVSRSEDYLLERRHAGPLPVSFTAAPLRRGDDISGAVIVFLDITERKRLDQARRDVDRRKDEFLAMLGHELRNPLAPIASAAHVIATGGAAERARAGGIIERQVQRMGRLVDDLLDVARITSGRVELTRRRQDLRGIVENAVESVRSRVDEHRHELDVSLPPEPLWMYADAMRLEQVAANLLVNAVKYTAPGGRLAAIAQRDGENAVLRVRDNGPGIDPELLPRIFELFSQGRRSSDRMHGGLGIGLAIVKRIVELHGGTVEATTKPGEGSEFVVRLPLATSDRDTADDEAGERPVDRDRQLRILVVDDNVDTAESSAMLLRSLKHEVLTAYDGETALRAAVAFVPEVILLDIGLPGMDGNEVAERLRRHSALRETVLVALTGYGQDADRQRSRDAGFDHHLTKPASFRDLKRILNAASQ